MSQHLVGIRQAVLFSLTNPQKTSKKRKHTQLKLPRKASPITNKVGLTTTLDGADNITISTTYYSVSNFQTFGSTLNSPGIALCNSPMGTILGIL